LGLRSRDTHAPGFSNSYREPLAIKVAGTAEIFRDYLYFTIGGNFPVYTGKINMEDTLALYETLNEYSPLPANAFLSPQALELGLFGQYLFPSWIVLTGFTYNRPTRFDGIPEAHFFPASYFNFIGRAILETSKARHRFDFKATIFTAEENEARIASHKEGNAWQLHYGYLHSYQKVAMQSGLGGLFKLPDANRQFKLKSELQPATENDNVQRAYAEFSLSWVPNPDILWRFHVVPKALFAFREAEFGSETELGASLGLKIWEAHRIRSGASFLFGNFAGKTYLGFGIKGEFAFRHLGFQDLDEQAQLEESTP
jgi:hypothetical protein